jgi:flagellar biosynthetic protein FliO
MMLQRLLNVPLAVTATLFLITFINMPLVAAQVPTPADNPAVAQARPLRGTWRSRHPQTSSEAPKEAEPTPAAVSTPAVATPLQTPAVVPLPADDRLPFMVANEPESREQPASASGLLLRTLGALALIVGLIVVVAWGMKRFGGARFGTPQENAPPLVVLNSLSLGDRRTLTIVRFGDRTLLLGSTSHAVTLLAETEPDDFPPLARSVADILNDEPPAAFSEELFSATAHLDDQTETRRGSRIIT